MIDPTAIVENSELGERLSIWQNSRIRNSVVSNNASVGEFSEILNSSIGEFASINRRNFVFRSTLGRFTYTGANSSVQSSKVGSFCSIGPAVMLGGGDHSLNRTSSFHLSRFENAIEGYNSASTSLGGPLRADLKQRLEETQDLEIGNDVWVGGGAIILRGLMVGHGAVVGAGAVVTKDVEPYSIVAGVPARRIGVRFDSETIERLLRIQWWNWPLEKVELHKELLFREQMSIEFLGLLEKLSEGS